MLAPILCDFIIGRDNSPVNCAPTSSSFCTTIHCSCGFLPLFFVSVHATHAGKRTKYHQTPAIVSPIQNGPEWCGCRSPLIPSLLLVAMGRALFSSPLSIEIPMWSITRPSSTVKRVQRIFPCCPMSYEQIDHHTYRLPPPFLLTRFPLDKRGHFTVGSMGLACA